MFIAIYFFAVAFAKKLRLLKVLDVENASFEDGGASFFDGNGGAAAAIVVTDAAIGVLGEEHFAIKVSIRYARVWGSAGPGVTYK